MADIDVKEDPTKRRTSWSVSGGLTHTQVWTVLFSKGFDPKAAAVIVQDSHGIPARFSAHPNAPYIAVTQKNARAISPHYYEVEVIYESMQSTATNWKVSRHFATSSEPIDQDIDGIPLTNSANEFYTPPMMREFKDLVLVFEKKLIGFDDNQALEYINTVNSDRFWGFQPGQCRIITYEGSPVSGSGLTWMEFMVRIEIQCRRDGWEKRRLDEGYRKIVGTVTDPDDPEYGAITYKMFRERDKNGKEGKILNQPRWLDGNGQALPKGGTPVYLYNKIFRETKFANLGLE